MEKLSTFIESILRRVVKQVKLEISDKDLTIARIGIAVALVEASVKKGFNLDEWDLDNAGLETLLSRISYDEVTDISSAKEEIAKEILEFMAGGG